MKFRYGDPQDYMMKIMGSCFLFLLLLGSEAIYWQVFIAYRLLFGNLGEVCEIL